MHDPCEPEKSCHGSDQKSDEELMLLYQNDHEEAFLGLYRRYAAKVYGFLCKKLRDPQAAADVCQIVFLKLHRSRDLYHATLPFAPWLFAMTRHALIDWQRTQAIHRRYHEYGTEPAIGPRNHEEPAPEVEVGIIKLANLPDAQRQAIEMRYLQDLAFEDIARRLGTSAPNARQLVSRGLKKIRSFFPKQEKKL